MAETEEYVIEAMNTTTEYTPTDPLQTTAEQSVCHIQLFYCHKKFS
jgi:hypothetical protein